MSIPQVKQFAYRTDPDDSKSRYRSVNHLLSQLSHARGVARAARQLRAQGFMPDVICAHMGWGESIFLKDVFPESKLLAYCEFFYSAAGADAGFDREFEHRGATADARSANIRIMNAPLLISLDAADAGISPTQWQRSRFPAVYQSKIEVAHEGIDTEKVCPSPGTVFNVPGTNVVLETGQPIVTYVARNLEPYRGFHIFMRSVPEILDRLPSAHVVVVGGDAVSYSPRLPPGQTYRQRALEECQNRIDLSRVHFVPPLPHHEYIKLLEVSAAHVYLTYPFVLSWSLLEAMAAGCLVIASRTAPVEEVVRDGENGLLVDFFSTHDIADKVAIAVSQLSGFAPIRARARQTVIDNFDLRRVCLPKQLALVERFGTA